MPDLRKVIPSKADGTAADLATQAGQAAVLAAVDTLEALTAQLVGEVDALEEGLGAVGDASAGDAGTGSGLAFLRSVRDRLVEVRAAVDGMEGLAQQQVTELAGLLEEATFAARMGEVQAAPTANTVLGRLKAIQDHVDTLETLLAQVVGTLNAPAQAGEAAAAAAGQATAAHQVTLNDHVDTLETLLAQIAGYLDGVEALVTAGNASLAAIQDASDGSNPATITVGSSAATIFAADGTRRGGCLQNNGVGWIRVTFGATVPTATRGIRVGPGDLLPFWGYNGQVRAIRETVDCGVDAQEILL